MLKDELIQQIKRFFPYKPTKGQEIAMNFFAEFICTPQEKTVYVLKGYAGTGKTTLTGAMIQMLTLLKRKCVLLAPTGRAAKVFTRHSGQTAYTIHKKIYRQRSFSNETDNFVRDKNLHQHTLFIVDEASMISNEGQQNMTFGTGHLLNDLIEYVYEGLGCRLMFVGDTAQLPPIGETESPAFSESVLQTYGLNITMCTLTEVVRQESESGILYNVTLLRRIIADRVYNTFPRIKLKGFSDIKRITGEELPETVSECYDKAGMEETIIICRSNKRAHIYNNGTRATILFREDELNTGERVMVAKNNYFWGADYKEMDFIANGDIAIVQRVRKIKELYGFRFAEVLLSFPDYNDLEIETILLLDTLHSDAPSLTKEENDRLFYAVLEDYADIPSKKERMKKMKSDPYYNALQVKYAYAITCHKAQGGQWRRVFLDQGYVTREMLSPDYYRWLYTAFTRATEALYLINWPDYQTDSSDI